MIVRELLAKLGFEVDAAPAQRFEAAIKSVGAGLSVVIGVGAAAVGSLYAIARSTAEVGDEAVKAAQKVGVSVEAFQELRYAADLADLPASALTDTLKFLGRNASEAAHGGKAQAEAFGRLGIRVTDANGKLKKTDDLLVEMSDRFAGMRDGGEKTAIAMTLLGRSAARAIPFLNSGTETLKALRQEARDTGVVLSEDAARGGEAMNDAMTRLIAAGTGLKNTIGIGLIPVVKAIADGLRDFLVQNRKILEQNLTEFFAGVTVVAQAFLRALGFIGVSIGKLVKSVGGMSKVLVAVKYALVALAGVKLAYALGAIVPVVSSLVVQLVSLKLSALAAWAATALGPIVIGLVIAALGLLANDLYYFFTGGQSLIGDFIKKWEVQKGVIGDTARAVRDYLAWMKVNGPEILRTFEGAGLAIQTAWDKATYALRDFWRVFKDMASWVDENAERLGRVFNPFGIGRGEAGQVITRQLSAAEMAGGTHRVDNRAVTIGEQHIHMDGPSRPMGPNEVMEAARAGAVSGSSALLQLDAEVQGAQR